MSPEFTVFMNYSWCFLLAGLVIRVFCWIVGYSVYWIGVALGGHNMSR